MQNDELLKALRHIGITTTAILLVGVAYAGFQSYKTFLETQKLKLDIKKLKKEA